MNVVNEGWNSVWFHASRYCCLAAAKSLALMVVVLLARAVAFEVAVAFVWRGGAVEFVCANATGSKDATSNTAADKLAYLTVVVFRIFVKLTLAT
jgi:hypothetical protein